MPDNYYDDTPEMEEQEEPQEQPESSSNTAILPKDFFPEGQSIKPGSTVSVRVTEVREDSVLVTYQSKSASKAGPVDPEMASMMQ